MGVGGGGGLGWRGVGGGWKRLIAFVSEHSHS